MSEWFVYDAGGLHRGPFTVDALVAAIRAGDVAEDALIAPDMWFESVGGAGWRPVGDVPDLRERLEAARRAEQLAHKKPPPRLVEGAFRTTLRGTPEFGATAMIVVGSSEPDESG